jgi:hypothetical protein
MRCQCGAAGAEAIRLTSKTENSNIKSLADLAARQGLNGGWEFAMLSFPRWHWAPQAAASFPTLFSTASGVTGLVAGPSSGLRPLDY